MNNSDDTPSRFVSWAFRLCDTAFDFVMAYTLVLAMGWQVTWRLAYVFAAISIIALVAGLAVAARRAWKRAVADVARRGQTRC